MHAMIAKIANFNPDKLLTCLPFTRFAVNNPLISVIYNYKICLKTFSGCPLRLANITFIFV